MRSIQLISIIRNEVLLGTAFTLTACTQTVNVTPDLELTARTDGTRSAIVVKSTDNLLRNTQYTVWEYEPVELSVTHVEHTNARGPSHTRSSRRAFGVTDRNGDGVLEAELPIP